MITFPNGHTYKLVYLDTNALNYIAKNTHETAKNFLIKFCLNGDYMFVTSAFNLYELFNAKYESRKKIIEFFNKFPLGMIDIYPQLIEFEKIKEGFQKDMISFVIGVEGIFDTQIEHLLSAFDKGSFYKSISIMKESFEKELSYWNSVEQNTQWMKNFNKSLIDSMNHLFKYSSNSFEI